MTFFKTCDVQACLLKLRAVSPKIDTGFFHVCLKACTCSECIKGIHECLDRGRYSLAKDNEVISKHKMSQIHLFAVGMKHKPWLKTGIFKESGKVIHGQHKKQGGKRIPLFKPSFSSEPDTLHTIDSNCKLNLGYAVHDPFDK